MSSQVIIFAFLLAGLNNSLQISKDPTLIVVFSMKECMVVNVEGVCECGLAVIHSVSKAEWTDSYLQCWVSMLSCSCFTVAACQLTFERKRETPERCFVFVLFNGGSPAAAF